MTSQRHNDSESQPRQPTGGEERLRLMLSSALGTDVSRILDDPLVTEVRVNSDGTIWQNRLGEGKRATGYLLSPEKARHVIYAVAYSVGAVCHEDAPHVSAELPISGQRFQGVLPPLTSNPIFSIRKKAQRIWTLDELVDQGVLTPIARRILGEAITTKKSIIVGGGTDSGKTTFANALLAEVALSSDRIVIIEDTQELQCKAPDVEYLRTKDGVASLRDLVRVTMRLSPDRIVIGEVRGAEALDLLKSWNTGHRGGISTLHASSAAKSLSRLEQLIQEAGLLHSRALIGDAVDVVVYMEKVGTRRIVKEICTVEGTASDGSFILTRMES